MVAGSGSNGRSGNRSELPSGFGSNYAQKQILRNSWYLEPVPVPRETRKSQLERRTSVSHRRSKVLQVYVHRNLITVNN